MTRMELVRIECESSQLNLRGEGKFSISIITSYRKYQHIRKWPHFTQSLLLRMHTHTHSKNTHTSTISAVSRRQMEMRVRATDPRPCPKCGKIYRSAHTLRTHLEDKHTVCPGYRCVLCGTVAKSRNSLHSHMSRQHRGISTKDLPVLPMPSSFDPELASRLLAKAGVKISAAELRARASPTSGAGGGGGGSASGQRRSASSGGGDDGVKQEYRDGGGDDDSNMGDMDMMMEDDPEDLTMGNGGHMMGGHNNNRYHVGQMHQMHQHMHAAAGGGGGGGGGGDNNAPGGGSGSVFNHPNMTITRVRHGGAMTPKTGLLGGGEMVGDKDANSAAQHLLHQQLQQQQLATGGATGSSILDTYLQFIQENTFGGELAIL